MELARTVGLSPAATLHRVRWLKKSGSMQIIDAQLDPAQAGFPLLLYITATLAVSQPRSTEIFEDQIRALPQIIFADNIASKTDYLMVAVARNVTELSTRCSPACPAGAAASGSPLTCGCPRSSRRPGSRWRWPTRPPRNCPTPARRRSSRTSLPPS